MPDAEVNLNVRREGPVSVVSFGERKILEELMINQIGERLSELAEAESAPKMLLDFGNVEHLSSAALGMLITLNKQLVGQQGQLVLANIHPQIYEVFKITRLNKLFDIRDTTEAGLGAFN
jgi:anti-sigma B factor antagonist